MESIGIGWTPRRRRWATGRPAGVHGEVDERLGGPAAHAAGQRGAPAPAAERAEVAVGLGEAGVGREPVEQAVDRERDRGEAEQHAPEPGDGDGRRGEEHGEEEGGRKRPAEGGGHGIPSFGVVPRL